MRRKALIINGPLPDLSDILAIARTEGKIVLGVDRVKVSPKVIMFDDTSYVVVVEEENGCSKTSGAEGRIKD